MRRWRQQRHSLIWKITASFVLLTVVPIFASYLLISVYWWNAAEETSVNQSRKILQYSKYLMEDHLLQMEKLTGSIYSNNRLLELLEAADEGLTAEDKVTLTQQLDTLFFNLSYSRPDVYKYYLFDLQGRLLYANQVQYTIQAPGTYKPQFEEWFDHTKLADGKSVFISTKLPFQDPSQTVFSISRLIKSKTEAVGVVLIDFNFSVLREIAAQSSLDNNSELIIADFDGNIIHHNAPNLVLSTLVIPEIRVPMNETLSGSQTVYIGDDRYLMIFDTLEKYTIKLVHLIPVKAVISANMAFMLKLSLVVFAFLLVMLATTVYFVARRIRPLRRLASLMERKMEEPFSLRIPVTTRDEIGTLERAFNTMMARLSQLFERDYKLQLEKAATERALLEAQINPHFLYNTLDTIRFKAMEQGNAEVSEMIYALSTNLRYTIANTSSQVTVREEVQWLERYMYLQKLRFHERFEVFFQIDVSIHDEYIYRLILQPFIENSIIHGFSNIRTGGILHINGYRNNELRLLCFDIVDNGKGFAYPINERVDYSMARQWSVGRIGMYNALNRLFMYYRDDCHVLIESIPGKRTAVQIQISLPEERSADDAHFDH